MTSLRVNLLIAALLAFAAASFVVATRLLRELDDIEMGDLS